MINHHNEKITGSAAIGWIAWLFFYLTCPGKVKMQVELNEKEIREISKCLHLEAEIWKFKRGMGKPTKEELYTVKVWKKFGALINNIASRK